MPDHPYTDWLKHDAAEQLATQLRDYWSSRGIEVRVWTEEAWLWRERVFYSVRSDLGLTLPQRETKDSGT
jgi:hypothetical protein